MDFRLKSDYQPMGDQPQAIKGLVDSISKGNLDQTLLGVTGSGKTFSMANVIQQLQRPALIISHNKTLAAQLYSEFKAFFPENAVEYFVSYYDYYQPEAYVPSTDTFIEKDSSINEEIERLRLAATGSLISRRDVIVIASVSCIYGLGSPDDFRALSLEIVKGEDFGRDELLEKLVEALYNRNDMELKAGRFRVRGDVVDLYPAYANNPIRVEFWGDEVEDIREIDSISGETIRKHDSYRVYPATQYVTTKDKLEVGCKAIQKELEEQVEYFEKSNLLLEAQRIRMRTEYDLEMLREVGFCSGIENYSRHLSNRKEGEQPPTLLEYFPSDWLLIVDESHVTLPQVRAMYKGDRSRKGSLVNYGFRLPSAMDNRPLQFAEFMALLNQVVFVSATPSEFEKEYSNQEIVEQIIRPTGLLDPTIEVRPVDGQVDDLLEQIRIRTAQGDRVLVTTTTKKMSERLADYFDELGVKARYLHSEIQTLERVEIIRDLRKGVFDVLIGINLLREGLDIPEVSLVAILDADKEGFLRNKTSLIQTIGRAARNVNGHAILYGNRITRSMQAAIDETQRRREIQEAHNLEHGIIPTTIIKEFHSPLEQLFQGSAIAEDLGDADWDISHLPKLITKTRKAMFSAAGELDFEKAAELKQQVQDMEIYLLQFS